MSLGVVAILESFPAESSLHGLMALGTLLGMVNTQLGLFNLLPGFPLDGGRALRAGLWAWSKDYYRATSQAALVGLLFGVTFGLFGALLLFGALSGTASSALASSGGGLCCWAPFSLRRRAEAGSRRSFAPRWHRCRFASSWSGMS